MWLEFLYCVRLFYVILPLVYRLLDEHTWNHSCCLIISIPLEARFKSSGSLLKGRLNYAVICASWMLSECFIILVGADEMPVPLCKLLNVRHTLTSCQQVQVVYAKHVMMLWESLLPTWPAITSWATLISAAHTSRERVNMFTKLNLKYSFSRKVHYWWAYDLETFHI